MPWTVQEGHDECEAGQWAVVVVEDDPDAGQLAPGGCHDSEADAQAQADALNIAEAEEAEAGDQAEPTGEATPFIALMAVEGPDQLGEADGRVFPAGAFSWRSLPLTVHTMLEKPDFGGHAGAVLSGRIEHIKRALVTDPAVRGLFGGLEGEVAIVGLGVFDHDAPAGPVTADLIGNGTLKGVSVDPGDVVVESACLQTAEDEFGEFCAQFQDVFLGYQIAGFTVVDVPGIPQATVRVRSDADVALFEDLVDLGPGGGVAPEDVPSLAGDSPSDDQDDGDEDAAAVIDLDVLIAAGAPAAVKPPVEYFRVPEPDELCPLTVDEPDEDGWRRVYGHAAPAEGSGICHIGYPGECKEAPPSPTSYAFFNTGYVLTDEGDEVPTGVLTMDCGHAPLRNSKGRALSAAEAVAHYDDNGKAVAFVHSSNGQHGWWLSGVVAPDLDEADVMRLRGGSLSGDWRGVGGAAEGVAALVVNVPGFPIPRQQSLVASGKVVAMVAAGVAHQCHECQENTVQVSASDFDALRREVDRQKALNSDREIDALTASVHSHTEDDVALHELVIRQD